MGREISYCASCGHRRVSNESGQGAAPQQVGRLFCATCHLSPPVGPATPLPPWRPSSTPGRTPAPAARTRQTTRIRKRSALGLVLALAGGALAVALILASGVAQSERRPVAADPAPMEVPLPARPQPTPTPDPAPALDGLLSRIREIRHADLLFERRQEILRLQREALARAGSRLEEVDQLVADYERTFEEAAARLADFTRTEALRMAARQRLSEAIERLDGFPSAFRTSKSAEALRQLRLELERRRASAIPGPPAPSWPPRRLVSDPE